MEPATFDDGEISVVKMESNLNFSTGGALSEDEDFYSKKKIPRDPLSHRIIEKRRRDRMNNCLADLSRLIPSGYMKKGRGRVEKTEIIEMAIRHMKHLQAHPCSEGSCCPLLGEGRETTARAASPEPLAQAAHSYRLGFNECLSETLHFLVEVEGFFSTDSLCLQLTSHLHNHVDNILKGRALKAQLTASQGKRRHPDDDLGDMKRPEGMEDCPDVRYANGFIHRDNGTVLHSLDSRQCNGQCAGQCGQCIQPCNLQCNRQCSQCLQRYQALYQHSETQPNRPIASPQQLSPPLSCPSEKGDSSGSYKFKDDIRKRFCREGSSGGGAALRPVPVFALSSAGSHYYPLTVELPVPTEEPIPTSDLVLHPVTISVNFNHNQS